MSKFHNFWLNEIKKASGASFVGYETEKKITKLKLIINGEPKYIGIKGEFNGINIETYSQILKELM